MVELHLVLDPVVELEVVVLQGGGGARGQASIGAGAVEQKASANGTQQNSQRAHDYDGEENGIQRVKPGILLARRSCHRRLCGRFYSGPFWDLYTWNKEMETVNEFSYWASRTIFILVLLNSRKFVFASFHVLVTGLVGWLAGRLVVPDL